MQEGRIVPPSSSIILQRQDLPLTGQEKRHMLLHVRTTGDTFLRYENVRQPHSQSQQQQPQASIISMSSAPASPVSRSGNDSFDKDRTMEVDERTEDTIVDQDDDEILEQKQEIIIKDKSMTKRKRRKPCNRNRLVQDRDDEDDHSKYHQDDEEEEEEEEEDEDEDEEEVEVDVCRDEVNESNPSSPVDLTAPSSRGTASSTFLHHPFATRGIAHSNHYHHRFPCIQNNPSATGQNIGPTGYISGHGATGSTVMTVCGSGNSVLTTSSSTANITTSSTVQASKRCLAFSVENILDPNKFTGGRVVNNRISSSHRRRAGSVHEGEYAL